MALDLITNQLLYQLITDGNQPRVLHDTHYLAIDNPHNSRAQNVPKTKVEPGKLVEITEDRKKFLVPENID